MQQQGIHRSVAGGFALLARDPVGVLVPVGAILILQTIVWVALRAAIWEEAWPLVGPLALALLVGRWVVGAPLRAATLAAGARALDIDISGWARTPSLLLVWCSTGLIETLTVGFALLLGLGSGSVMLQRGLIMPAIIAAAVGAVLAVAALLLLRAAFVYCAVLATAGQRSAPRALLEGLQLAAADPLGALAVSSSGELAFASGAMLCGVGALPGYPISDLAALHRWAHARENLP